MTSHSYRFVSRMASISLNNVRKSSENDHKKKALTIKALKKELDNMGITVHWNIISHDIEIRGADKLVETKELLSSVLRCDHTWGKRCFRSFQGSGLRRTGRDEKEREMMGIIPNRITDFKLFPTV